MYTLYKSLNESSAVDGNRRWPDVDLGAVNLGPYLTGSAKSCLVNNEQTIDRMVKCFVNLFQLRCSRTCFIMTDQWFQWFNPLYFCDHQQSLMFIRVMFDKFTTNPLEINGFKLVNREKKSPVKCPRKCCPFDQTHVFSDQTLINQNIWNVTFLRVCCHAVLVSFRPFLTH